MNKRIGIAVCLLLLLGSLFLPFVSIYPHMALDPDVASAFPETITGFQLIVKGTAMLPVNRMPALAGISFRTGLLAAGIGLSLCGGLLALLRRRYGIAIAPFAGLTGSLALFLYCFYVQQLDQSMLFHVMLTAKWYVWLAFAASAILTVLEFWTLREMRPLPIGDKAWRLISAGLCALSLLLLFLPYATAWAPAGTFQTPAEDALARRSVSGWQWILDQEPMLQNLGAAQSAYADPIAGEGMRELARLSDSARDVQNLFLIPTRQGGARSMALAAVCLLLIGMALQLAFKVNRWIPACVLSLGAVLLGVETVGALAVDSSYQFMGATAQLMYLGLGGYTFAPLAAAGVAAAASCGAVLGIRRADDPYFYNPIPARKRLWAVSLGLAVLAFALLFLPVVRVNLYTPGKVNRENPTVQRPMYGAELIAFQTPVELTEPASSRGKALYGQEPAANGLTVSDLSLTVERAVRKLGALLLASLGLMGAGLTGLLFFRKNKRLIIAALLSGIAMLAALYIAGLGVLPKEVGHVSGMAPLFAAMGIAAFAAFFAGFLNYEELPKKFKLFLMMLPFLVAVFLFAYLPLSGWRYAFYNYKLGLPMDQQEYVGFKWFVSLFSSVAQRTEIVRVLRNTFAMSGLGLASSWLPVAFAIFLTEIRSGWYKKFVQIFTTLPNFISWVLVFSFALTIFSMDTGIVNKVLLRVGLIQAPVAYLNSGEHIWLKMWMWNTWKGLGWGAIMYLAAIAGIDQELYEAAKVDGAGRWRQIRHITIPGLLPTFFVLLLLSISNIVNNGMEQYLVFQNAMNKSAIEVLDLYVFNISLGSRSSNTISMATAIGLLKSLVSIVLLFLANNFSKLVRGESIV